MPTPGVEAWAVFGTMRLIGIERATAQLAAFEVAGKQSAETILGMSRNTALVVGGLGLLGTAISVQGIRKFAQFDAAMTESLAIMGDVSSAMEEDMAQAARKMARETTFSAEETAESYFFLASAGLDARESIKALPVVAKFAQAGMFDMARATELATDAQSALGLTSSIAAENTDNLARVTNVLVGANTLANASTEQFAESLTNRAAARARIAGKEIEEVVAVLAAFADVGIKGRRAGTLFDRTLRELTRRARENEEAFKQYNIEVFDSEENVRNMADIIEDMEEAFAGMTPKAKGAALAQLGFTQRSMEGILVLQGMSDQIRISQKALEEQGNIQEEVAEKQLDTLINQFKLLGSAITDVFIGTGSPLGKALTEIVRFSQEAINAVADVQREAPGLGERGAGFSLLPGTRVTDPNKRTQEEVLTLQEALIKNFRVMNERMAENKAEELRQELELLKAAIKELVQETDIFLDQFETLSDLPTPGIFDPEERRERIEELIGPMDNIFTIRKKILGLLEDENLEQEQRLQLVRKLAEIQRRIGEGITPTGVGEAAALQFPRAGGFFVPSARQGPISEAEMQAIEERAREAAKRTGESFGDTLAEELRKEELKNDLRGLGFDLIDSLIMGTFDAEQFARKAISILVKRIIVAPIFDTLGIFSPSKVMRDAGENISIGLVEGIDRQRSNVKSAWMRTVDELDTGSVVGRMNGLNRLTTNPGRMAAGAIRSLTPSISVKVDTEDLPPPQTPFDVVRDSQWQRVLRTSIDFAREDGFE